MSDIKITVQDDIDKNLEEDHIPEQASLDTSLDMHANEDEEKDVRRSVLHKEEERQTGREELKDVEYSKSANNKTVFEQEYIVGYNQPPQGPGQGWFPQGPPQAPPQGEGQGWFSGPPQGQGQGQGWFSQGPPQGQGQGWYPQGPPQGQGQGQGWFSGPPQGQGQGQGWFPQGPPQDQGHAPGWFSRHPAYTTGPPIDYSPDKEDRNVFVRKVMVILLVMLLVTVAFMLVVLLVETLREIFTRFSMIIVIPSLVGLMVLGCYMPTSKCARVTPTNYLCLVLVVILESLVVAGVSARYKTEIIVQAFLATVVVVIVCVMLSFTKFDFTKCILIIVCVMVALSVVAIAVMIARFAFDFHSKPLMIVILVGFTIVNIVMLIIELQMVLGGKSVELSEEDYALGAYMLYTSIIQLFINIIGLLGLADS